MADMAPFNPLLECENEFTRSDLHGSLTRSSDISNSHCAGLQRFLADEVRGRRSKQPPWKAGSLWPLTS